MQEKVITEMGNKCFENVIWLKYFVLKLTTRSCVPGEIRRLNWGVLATVWSRISCLAVSCLKHQDLNIQN